MTGAGAGTEIEYAARLKIETALPPGLPLVEVVNALNDIEALFVVAGQIAVAQELARMAGGTPDPRYPGIVGAPGATRTELYIHRIQYGSPLEVVVGITPYAMSAMAAVRGLLYLWERWSQARVSNAAANYRVEAYTLLTRMLGDSTPSNEVQRAALGLISIGAVSVEDDEEPEGDSAD